MNVIPVALPQRPEGGADERHPCSTAAEHSRAVALQHCRTDTALPLRRRTAAQMRREHSSSTSRTMQHAGILIFTQHVGAATFIQALDFIRARPRTYNNGREGRSTRHTHRLNATPALPRAMQPCHTAAQLHCRTTAGASAPSRQAGVHGPTAAPPHRTTSWPARRSYGVAEALGPRVYLELLTQLPGPD